MSNQDNELDQTLIPKDDEEQWRKVLHGEMVSAEDDETQLDAAAIRNYLIARDEAIAVKSVAEIDDLNTISEEEARIFYHNAANEINRRGKDSKFEALKKYGSVFLIGMLFATVLFLLLRDGSSPTPTNAVTQSNGEALNFSDYKVVQFKELPGLFPNMLLVPGGRFNAGCTTGWDDVPGGCRPSEFPAYLAKVDTFELAQHEVTVGQFKHFVENTQYETVAEKDNKGCVHQDTKAEGRPWVMNRRLNWKSPGYAQDDHYPVTCVSWADAQAYITWLGSETNTPYRLPTEVEWEYAARGGQSTAYFWGSAASNDQANYQGVGGQDVWPFAAPVGSFPGNQFLIQDTAGNVWEWVEDCWYDTYDQAPTDGSAWVKDCSGDRKRVRRGGGWDGSASGIRSATRSAGSPFDRSNLYGFRVARDWQKKK